ncbi:MAG: DUF5320 domain-containing protein [Bacteroidales bacterium]
MPSGDHTGPVGQGPMTGRSSGFCSGNEGPGYLKGFRAGMGRGGSFGRGRGHGRGRGKNFGGGFAGFFSGFTRRHSMSREDEINMLKSQSEFMKRSQQDIEKRLGELEKEGL